MLDETRALIKAGTRRIVQQLPTGGGKTVLAATMLHGTAQSGKRAAFVVHRKELIDQTATTFTAMGIAHSFIAAGRPLDASAKVQICGVQTMTNRLDELGHFDLICWDEAHHVVAASYANIMARYPNAIHIGPTATPQRLDGRGLHPYFDAIVCGPQTAELIARGFLSRFRYYAPGIPDLVGVKTFAGDFNRGDLSNIMDKPKLIGSVVETYLQLAAGEQGVVFNVDRQHSRNVAAAFKADGVAAAHIDGAMHADERAELVAAWRAGEIKVMNNVGLFGEGVDLPGLVYAGLNSPTQSLSKFLQECGRPLRVFAGKTGAIIADHSGNAFRHGLPDDDREWTLADRVRSKKAANDDACPIRQCPICFRVVRATVKVCPGCDHVYAIKPRIVTSTPGELFELERVTVAARKKAEEKACHNVADFIALAKRRDYPDPVGWAGRQIDRRANIQHRYRPHRHHIRGPR